ncbi:hypothetical protein GJ496_000176 [Pomphorhynchus laevis]|nr:hypothetical protein GJ496_000176 [Pomphorhynchus laevis]
MDDPTFYIDDYIFDDGRKLFEDKDMNDTEAYLKFQRFVYENWFVFNIDQPPCSASILDLCGESLIYDVYHPELLEQSFKYLIELPKPLTFKQTVWQMRIIRVYCLLLNKIPNLLTDLIGNSIGSDLPTWFYLETFRTLQIMGQSELASKCLHQIKNMPKLNFTGKLGKRTKFQREYIAQLVVDISDVSHSSMLIYKLSIILISNAHKTKHTYVTDDFFVSKEHVDPISELNDVALTDDLLLSDIQFKEEHEEQNELKNDVISEILILALLDNQILNTSLEQEWEFTYAIITYLLNKNRNTSIAGKISILHLRCCIDKTASRRIERAIAQLNVLLEFQPKTAKLAFYNFYLVNMPNKHKIRRFLGELNLQLGQYSSALKQFECLNNWHGMLLAYKGLNRSAHAINMLDQQIQNALNINEYRKLMCAKAEINRDETILEELEMRNEMNAHSWRVKANICFSKGLYEQAILAFTMCLQVNSIVVSDWFLLGLSNFRLARYKDAKTAFYRHCSLDPDSANGWNNLATTLIKLGEKSRAQKLLASDGTRLDYGNWRVWENFLLVSVDCNEWSDAVLALDRIVEIRNGNVNEDNDEILLILSEKNVFDNFDDRLKSKFNEIVKRMVDMKATPERLVVFSRLNSNYEQKLEYMRKALAMSLSRCNDDHDNNSKIIDISVKLAELCLEANKQGEFESAIRMALLSFKSVRSRPNVYSDRLDCIIKQLNITY